MHATRRLLKRESLRQLAAELLGVEEVVTYTKKEVTNDVVILKKFGRIEEVDVRVAVLGVFRRGHGMVDSDDVFREVQTSLRRIRCRVSDVGPNIWSELVDKVIQWKIGAVIPMLNVLNEAGIRLDKAIYLSVAKKFGEMKQVNNALTVVNLSLAAHQPCKDLLTLMVYVYKKQKDFAKALTVFCEYWKAGVDPGVEAFSMLISSAGDLKTGIAILNIMIKNNIAPNEHTVTALMECCVKQRLLESAKIILKASKDLGHGLSQSLWLHYIRVHRENPSYLPGVLDHLKGKSIPLTTPMVFLTLSYYSRYATTPGNAAVLHAERLFTQSLTLPLHNPGQVYSEMLAVYINSGDHQGVRKIVEMVRKKYSNGPLPYLFRKRVRKYNNKFGKKIVV